MRKYQIFKMKNLLTDMQKKGIIIIVANQYLA